MSATSVTERATNWEVKADVEIATLDEGDEKTTKIAEALEVVSRNEKFVMFCGTIAVLGFAIGIASLIVFVFRNIGVPPPSGAPPIAM